MKYSITYACGHEGTVDIWGKGSERERKINFFERCGLCPECYKAQMQKKAAEQPLVYNFSVLPAITTDGQLVVYGYFSGNTMPVKDDIKALGGYRWEDCHSAEYDLLAKAPPKCWGKLFTESALAEEIQKAKSIGAEIKGAEADGCEITSLGQLVGYGIAAKLKAEYEEKQSMISALHKPDRPAVLAGKEWNGKIYRDAIYLDGEKTVISTEDKKALEDYLKAMEQYRSEKKKILERHDHE